MDAHRKLAAWRRCHELAVVIYEATDRFPRHELFGLTSQLRRAAVSASSNIAEGYARRGRLEFRKFLGYSLGSLAEVDSILEIVLARGYIDREGCEQIKSARVIASKTTYALLCALRRR